MTKKKQLNIRKCDYCGKEFNPTGCNQKYCCKAHAQQARLLELKENRRINKINTVRECKYCGKEFNPTHLGQVYCCVEHRKLAKEERHPKEERALKNHEYYEKNKDKFIADARQYRQEHKAELKEKNKVYRTNNKEAISKRGKKYYEKNSEIIKAKRRVYVDKNRDEVNRKQREAYHANIEGNRKKSKENYLKHKETYREYNKTHKEQRNQRRRQKRATDPVYNLKRKCRGMIHRCIGKKKNWKKSVDILGYTPEQLRTHLETQFTEEMNWDNYGTYWHIDHIKPLNAFKDNFFNKDGSVNWDIVKEANALSNLKPLEATENLTKSATWTEEDEEEYRRRNGI